MPTEMVPGFFDFLGQGLSGVATTIQDKRKREEDKERDEIERTARLVAQGLMDPQTANALPIAQKFGLKFAETPMSTARSLLQQGPTVTPDLSKYVAPTAGMTGSITGPEFDVRPPGTADQRAFAGLPSAGALAADETNAMLSRYKSRYFKDASPEQLEVASGLPSIGKVQRDARKELDPILTASADRHIDTLLNSTQIDLTDAKALRRSATALANQAYQNYLQEAAADGSIQSMSPQDKAYARSFFQKSIADRAKEADDAQFRLRIAREGRGGTEDAQAVRLYSALTATADDFDRQVKELRAGTLGTVVSTISDEAIAKQPHLLALRDQIRAAEQSASKYRRNALKALAGKLDLREIEGLSIPEVVQPTASGGQISDASPQEFEQYKMVMRQVPAGERAAELEKRKHLLSAADYEKLKKELGIK